MRLSLQSDPHVLDGTRDHRVGYSSKSSSGIVLSIGEAWGEWVLAGVVGFEAAAGFMESTELHGHAGTDSDQRRESTFIESESTFLGIDCFGGNEGVGVLGCCLEADFDYVEGLAWEGLV